MKRYLFKSCIISAVLIMAILVMPLFAQQDTTLTIIHSGDGESALKANDYSGSVAQYAAIVKSIVAEVGKDNSLVVSAGDNYLAGPEYEASEGVLDALALSLAGVEVSAFGNHEFDLGTNVLAQFVKRIKFSYVSSNLDFSQVPELQRYVGSDSTSNKKITTTRIIEKAGVKIGITGATTEMISYISSPGKTIINDVAASLRSAVQELQAEGVDIIIALTHLQNIEEEKKLAASIDGIDIFVAGGGDDIIGNANNSYLVRKNRSGDSVTDRPTGPYPFRTRTPNGDPILVVSTDGSYNYVGRLDVTFDDKGVITNVGSNSGPVAVFADGATDKQIDARVVRKVEKAIAAFARQNVGRSVDGLDGTRELVRSQETTMGNAISDGYLYSVNQLGIGAVDFAFTNGGGIRKSIVIQENGNITKEQLLTALPFTNYLTIVRDLTANEIKSIFEHSVAELPEAAGRFLQVAGITVMYNSSRTPGSRVMEITINGDTVVSGGRATGTKTYSAVTNSFVAGGGDGYATLKSISRDRKVNSGHSYADGFELYLEDESPIKSPISGRLVDLNS